MDQPERYRFAKDLLNPSESVLDIACGTGYGTLLLSEKCSNITGVDISNNAIQYANKHYKKNNKINFIQSSIFDYNQEADFVVSFETIEHIDKSIEEVVLKLLSLARKKLIFSTPYLEKSGNNPHHIHFNINEDTFNFLSTSLKLNFFYQLKNGKIEKIPKDNTLSLIVVIEK